MRRFAFLLISIALASPALVAQDCPRFGLQAGLVSPGGALKDATDDKAGYSLGLHAVVPLASGHVLRPRLDYLKFPTSTYISGGASMAIQGLAYGLDYLYFPAGQSRGIYLTGGIAAINWKMETEINFLGSMIHDEATTTKLGLAAGVGYQFNKTLGAELRHQTSRAWDGSYGRTGNGNFNTTQLGLTFRF